MVTATLSGVVMSCHKWSHSSENEIAMVQLIGEKTSQVSAQG